MVASQGENTPDYSGKQGSVFFSPHAPLGNPMTLLFTSVTGGFNGLL
jgi:hypothetical protein